MRRGPRYTARVSDFSQSYATRVAASLEDCFAVLTDFDDYPRWASPITECRVLERWPDGLPKRVAFALDMTIKTVRYVLEYTWDPPHGGKWHLVEGDLASVQGAYTFDPAEDGVTATCTQAIDLGFWVPGFLRSAAEKKALRDSVEEFRAAVEARARRAG
jgi:uncharacterized membrane protein